LTIKEGKAMAWKYERNYTEQGYIMNYRKGTKAAAFKNRVLQFKIELVEISPVIWRRILVPFDYNFWDLHVAMQDAMGWLDYHLHHFEIRGKGKKGEAHIGIPDFDRFDEMKEVYPGWEIPLMGYFNDLDITAKYLYDYGDSWHMVRLEGYLCKEKNIKYPLCIAGERACPPEDCGGVGGYYEMLKILSGPMNAEYKEMKRWVGKDWDPEKFDKDAIKFDDPYKRWEKAFPEKEQI
jgi:hypothetical protein